MPSAKQKDSKKAEGDNNKAIKKKSTKSTKSSKKKNIMSNNLSSFIHKIMKECEGNPKVKKDAMDVLNKLVNICFEKVASQAGRLTIQNGMSTLSERHIESACKMVFPPELAKHACSEAKRAVTKYSSHAYVA